MCYTPQKRYGVYVAKVSVVIPVYNVEKYLRECLDSLINQTLSDIEILCIDGGSKDKSVEILNEYKERDSRIKVFTHNKRGPSAARNTGIKNATGDYITFVDSDDWVREDMCEKIYNKAISSGADVVLFSFYRVKNKNINQDVRLEKFKSIFKAEVFNFDDNVKEIIENAPVETVGKLYKASTLKDVLFPESVTFGEDICFFYKYCLQNPKISILPQAFYYYRMNVANSLIKRPDTIKELYRVVTILKKDYKKSAIKHKKEFFNNFIKRISSTFTYYWKSVYTVPYRKQYYKYLFLLYFIYKTVPRKDDKNYKELKKYIYNYPISLCVKFFEPFIEIENRKQRFVIYLFKNQVLNISKINFKQFFIQAYYGMFYNLILWKLRLVGKFRKIRVGFFVFETTKWNCQVFYERLKKDERFEPFILLSYFNNKQGNIPINEYYSEAKKFFRQNGAEVYDAYDINAKEEKEKYKDLKKFKADIIFYQQPWAVKKEQCVEKTHKNSLLCYIPYCFYSMDSYLNYLWDFQALMWKYFVETDLHKKEYEQKYGAKNCITVGSTKLDGYHFINSENAEKCWKTKNKKRIIYAPHHSFDDGLHEVATFRENGQFILELAKKHPETEWIFRPHPAFSDRVVKKSVMSEQEIENYYKEWEKIGSVSTGGNYYEMFSASDCLITDCISFLSEYAPTCKPVLHLRKNYQRDEFNALVKKIDEGYYQIYSNDELQEVFENVVIKNEDYLAEKRELNKNVLPTEVLASEKIYEYLKKTLWI